MKLTSTVLLLALVTTGCAYKNSGFKEDLSNRASFEMDCEKKMMNYVPLKTEFDGIVSSYGVRGCNKKAVYIRLNGTWVLNSTAD
jgi:hypothetical protein